MLIIFLKVKDKLQPKVFVNIASDILICLHDILDFMVDEKIEGIDVLFDQSFNLEKCW